MPIFEGLVDMVQCVVASAGDEAKMYEVECSNPKLQMRSMFRFYTGEWLLKQRIFDD